MRLIFDVSDFEHVRAERAYEHGTHNNNLLHSIHESAYLFTCNKFRGIFIQLFYHVNHGNIRWNLLIDMHANVKIKRLMCNSKF